MKRHIKKLLLLQMVVAVILPSSVSALSQDQINVYNSGIYYYDVNSGSAVGTGSICLGSGTLPETVPDPYNSIFTAASNKSQIAPALLAAIFYAGEHGSSWPNPPAPYGDGSAWASSGVPSPGASDWPTQPPGPGAAGPFQFEYPTWQKYGIDGNGDGVTDVEDLTDAAFGAASYLAASGAKNTTDEQSIRNAIFSYNHSQDYVNNVWNAFVTFSTGGSSSSTSVCASGSGTSAAGFTNPFPGGWIPNRLDMGYDGTFSGTIVAPFSGTITYASVSFSNWGGYLEIRADTQPSGLPTSTLYFAEGVRPVVAAGQHVNSGDPIASPAVSPYGNAYGTTPGGIGQIEWGVAADGSSVTDPLSEAALGSGKCPAFTTESRSMVLNFANWAEQALGLAAPLTTSDAGCS